MTVMPRLLLIDDDAGLGEPLAAYVARFGMTLQQATRPSEGLALLRAGGFDAAILDVMLPEMDGLALCRVIRAESDIPIASDKAYFVDPHVSIGYVSSHEMVNMARRVPVAVCLRMALLGNHERMPAQRAYEVGLVTEVVPHERLLERANELADLLCKNAPLAMYGTKMGILRGLGLPIEQAEEIAAGYLEVVEQSEDHKEGPRSFVEKRPAQWKAR